MLRPLLFGFFACLALTGCQVEQPPQITTPQERLARSAAALSTCAQFECERLDLDSQLVADYAAAISMTHVTALMASWSNLNDDDLGKIVHMRQLRELHIGSTQVTSIAVLPNLPNLTVLHLQWNKIGDFSPLARMGSLEELALGGNDVGDLRYLGGLHRLKALNLASAKINSFDGLRGHPSLEALDLENAGLPEDLTVLETIPNLKSLSISDWNLTEDQTAVVADLEARGVVVTRKAVVVVC